MTVEIKKVENSLPVAALREMLESCLAEGFPMLQTVIDDWNNNTNRFNKPGEALFIAEEDGRIVGIGGRNIDPYMNDKTVARVRRLYVLPAFRRQAVGRMLMEHIMDVPPGMFTRMTLCTPNPSTAGKFYESMGFSFVGEGKITHQLFFLNNGVKKHAG